MKTKPFYEEHRRIKSPAAENVLITDAGIINDLKLRGPAGDELIRGAMQCHGWKTIDGVVFLTAGTTPTVTLQPLEVVQYKDADGETKDRFVVHSANIGPLNDGDKFSISAVNGGAIFLRLQGVTGAPTEALLALSGGERDLEALRVG